jgi:hypothetical protein
MKLFRLERVRPAFLGVRSHGSAGNGAFRGADLESSGIRGANAPGDQNYAVRFPKRSPDAGFKYICLIHPFMRGSVVVG